MSASPIRFTLTAGQVSDVPIEFTDESGAPVDLTGATVHLVAKRKLTDDDADAIVDLSQDTHADAEAGLSSLPVDLSSLDDAFFETGANLTASLWLEDAAGNRIPYGNFTLEIKPNAKREWS